ncbi:MAG: hypothetical protein F4032_12155 [Gemmatimonadetes bacterium]|nr:hypothetical protein [Gemmatimonadota bacterium]
MVMFEIGIMVAIIILASAAYKYVEHRTRGSVPSDAEERLSARMDELDRRLTDIQDVMITIDEKLSRK